MYSGFNISDYEKTKHSSFALFDFNPHELWQNNI
jgi:hypothetical protein